MGRPWTLRPQLRRDSLGGAVLNYDPRDESESRPQVGFRLKAGAFDAHSLFDTVRARVPTYHDMMLFDASGGEIPGTLRFDWGTANTVVDATAQWMSSLPYVVSVSPSYGGRIGAA